MKKRKKNQIVQQKFKFSDNTHTYMDQNIRKCKIGLPEDNLSGWSGVEGMEWIRPVIRAKRSDPLSTIRRRLASRLSLIPALAIDYRGRTNPRVDLFYKEKL